MSFINYSYKVLKYRPRDLFMQVRYDRVGYDPIIRNFQPPRGLTPETAVQELTAFCEANAPVRAWDLKDAVEAEPVVVLPDTAVDAVYEIPTPPAEPEPPTAEELEDARVDEVIAEAKTHTTAGVYWDAPNGTTYYIPTRSEDLQRIREMREEIRDGRTDGGKWRVGLVNEVGDIKLTHIALNIAQFTTMTQKVKTHIEKTMEAEAITVGKVRAGNLDADYMTEYNAL